MKTGEPIIMKKKFPWKQNLTKIPKRIVSELNKIKDENIIVATIVRISRETLVSGYFSHLGISVLDGKLVYPERIVPNKDVGRYSKYNIEGREIVRKDLPKYYKTWEIETPNYGDWDNGSHFVEFGVWTYPREFYSPKYIEIEIELITDFDTEDQVTIKFKSSEILNRKESDFNDSLLYNLNLLQENVGSSNIYKSDATRSDFLKTIQINWEILPPGDRDGNISRILSGQRISPAKQKEFEERYDFLMKFNPIKIIKGTSGFQRYFGVSFSDNLIVFENVHYGNAIYCMYEDWEALSKKSRLELLSDKNQKFDRFIHHGNWKRNLYNLLNSKLEKKIRLRTRELR